MPVARATFVRMRFSVEENGTVKSFLRIGRIEQPSKQQDTIQTNGPRMGIGHLPGGSLLFVGRGQRETGTGSG